MKRTYQRLAVVLSFAMLVAGIVSPVASAARIRSGSASTAAFAASCTKPSPTTAEGYQQLIRGSIDGYLYNADSGQSVKLPNGKTLWTFGDTFVRPDTQNWGGTFINNSAIITDNGCATSITGQPDTSGNVTSWIKPTGSFDLPGVNDYYWPSSPFVDGGYLYVILWHMYNDATGFHTIGQDIAKFDVSGASPRLMGLFKTPGSLNNEALPLWGAAVVRHGGYTYIYGGVDKHEVWVFGKYHYLARVPDGKATNQSAWQFWSGSKWVKTQAAAQPVIPGTAGVGTNATVYQRTDGKFVLISKKYDIVGTDIVAWTANSLTGPWIETATLVSPIPDVDDSTGEVTYFGLAHNHTQLASGGILLSWSLNQSDASYFGSPRYGVNFVEVPQP